MKKNKFFFNDLLRRYHKYLRKRKNLMLADRNYRRQAILTKHIERLFAKLSSLQLTIQKGSVVATVAIGGLMIQSNVGNAQTFGPLQTNPFGLTNIANGTDLSASSPSFADLDGDGDLDVMSANFAANGFVYYENTGTTIAPAFGTRQDNPFSLVATGESHNVTLVDLDGDNDFDLLMGDFDGNFHYFENTGTPSAPAFGTEQINPFGLTVIGYSNNATLADLDNDGDLDLIAGDDTGDFFYYPNNGSSTAPAFGAQQNNPFSLTQITQTYSLPSFGDLDNDGDFDLISGDFAGNFHYFENTGTSSAPVFGPVQMNPFSITNNSNYISSSTFVDIDGDGDLDLMVNEYYGDFQLFENITLSNNIVDHSNSLGLNIYPNPTNNVFTIEQSNEVENTKITITSIDGKTVYNNSVNKSLTLDASSWSKGVYLVHVNNNKNSKTTKLIVQ